MESPSAPPALMPRKGQWGCSFPTFETAYTYGRVYLIITDHVSLCITTPGLESNRTEVFHCSELIPSDHGTLYFHCGRYTMFAIDMIMDDRMKFSRFDTATNPHTCKWTRILDFETDGEAKPHQPYKATPKP